MAAGVEPWRGPHWYTSPHNWAPEVAIPPRPVALHDVTLRDGEECADLAWTVEDKVAIAEALAALGLRRTELFLTVPGWYEAVRAILARRLPLTLYVTWEPGRVERVLDLGVRHVMVWYRASDVFQRGVLGQDRAALRDQALAQIARAKTQGLYVNVFLPESSRATLDQLRADLGAFAAAGADAFTLVDSQGVMRPAAMGYLVRQATTWTDRPIEVHCHNDFGLAVANVLAAYENGAAALNVTVNGLGYRAGNAALDEVVLALETLYNVRTGVRLELLPWVAHLVAERSRIPLGYFKPVTGRGAFRYEQWTAIARLTEAGERPAAFPFEPELVGRTPELVIGKWSDLGAVRQKLRAYGLTAAAPVLEAILAESQRQALGRKRPLTDDEFLALARAQGAVPAEGDD
jgi:isopropylmalate/homocitrate/citramalate synthase